MHVEIRRILFPTDFSDPAREAQKYAVALAERFGAELHLLHVIAPIPAPAPDANLSWMLPDAVLTYQVDDAKKQLVQELGKDWVDHHTTVLTVEVGFAVDEIVRYSKKNHIDVIVVGTHGHTGLSHLLLGSVAEKVVRLADCPVLTVHPKGHQFLIDSAQN